MLARAHALGLTPVLAAAILAAPAALDGQIADSATVTVRATVEAIDHTSRIVALKGPLGNVADFQVAEEVERFDDLAVGDTITATYTEALAVSLRKPGEVQPAAEVMTSEVGRTIAQRTISVSVEEIDRAVPSVTVRGPEGRVVSFRVPDGVSVDDVDVGDSIDVTYTIALVVEVN
jgi:hypothetical protein